MATLEVNAAPDGISGDGIDFDVREATAELEGVLAPQIRETVSKIVIRVDEAARTVRPLTDKRKRGNADVRQTTHSRDACVDGIACATSKPTAIGEDIAVADALIKVNVVVAKAGLVY